VAQQERSTPPNGTDDRSTPELLKAVASDTSTLVKQQIELARHELVEALVARAKAAGALAGAGVIGLYVLLFLGVAGALALARALPGWAAFLIVAGVFGVLALGAAVFGRFRMQQPPMAPEETVRTVKEDVEWAKTQLRR
jgi:cytochrome c biogenesis protein CcdA